jgi:hypothetical protein
MTRNIYSRLASVEEKKNIKNAYKYVALSIIAILLLVFLGLPVIVKLAGFIGDIKKSSSPVEVNDITPPAPPQFDQIPEYTKDERLEIKGKSESGATISITTNGSSNEVVANNSGEFNYIFNLKKGENTISAIANDQSNNKSTQSQEFKIVFDNEEPKLEITSPTDGASLYGNSQRQLSIKGNVSEAVDLTVNGRVVMLKDDNTFSYTSTLNEGENKFEVKAIDPSGNETLTTLTINFSL